MIETIVSPETAKLLKERKFNVGTIYEEYISQILVECEELVVGYTRLMQDDYCTYTDMCYTAAYNAQHIWYP